MIEKPITDAVTGETTGKMMLLPPAKHLCQTCATEHEPELPHNAQSLYYQAAFQMEHGRSPTWIDAMEHCDETVREGWGIQLDTFGVKWREGEINPPKAKG